MTLQSSGIIKLTQIAAEYGDAKPHKLTELYGKPGLPTSGRIDFTDFYGKSAYVAPVEKSISIAGVVIGNDAKSVASWAANAAGPIVIQIGGVNYTLGRDANNKTTISPWGLSVTPAPPLNTPLYYAMSNGFGKTLAPWKLIPDSSPAAYSFYTGVIGTNFPPNGGSTLTIWYT